VIFMRTFINSRPNFTAIAFNLSRPNFGNCLLLIFWSLEVVYSGKNQTVFLNIWYNDVLLMGTLVVGNLSRHYPRYQTGKAPQTRDLWAKTKDASIRFS
jgi:hypothetical protein